MTLGNLQWLEWYIRRCAGGVEMDAETHALALGKVQITIERKRMQALKRRHTMHERHGQPLERKERRLHWTAYAP